MIILTILKIILIRIKVCFITDHFENKINNLILFHSDQVLIIHSNGNNNASIESPLLFGKDIQYEFSFEANLNFNGHIHVVIRQGQIESQILKVNGNRDKM